MDGTQQQLSLLFFLTIRYKDTLQREIPKLVQKATKIVGYACSKEGGIFEGSEDNVYFPVITFIFIFIFI